MKKRLGDLLGLFLVLQGIVTLYYSYNLSNDIVKFAGLIGSSGLIIVELFFLYQTWVKNG